VLAVALFLLAAVTTLALISTRGAGDAQLQQTLALASAVVSALTAGLVAALNARRFRRLERMKSAREVASRLPYSSDAVVLVTEFSMIEGLARKLLGRDLETDSSNEPLANVL